MNDCVFINIVNFYFLYPFLFLLIVLQIKIIIDH